MSDRDPQLGSAHGRPERELRLRRRLHLQRLFGLPQGAVRVGREGGLGLCDELLRARDLPCVDGGVPRSDGDDEQDEADRGGDDRGPGDRPEPVGAASSRSGLGLGGARLHRPEAVRPPREHGLGK